MDRSAVLLEAGKLITQERNIAYGEPADQLAHAQQIKKTVGHHDSDKLTLAEVEAIDMICTKLSRLACGNPSLDSYMDIIGYAAIAAEVRTTKGEVAPPATEPLGGTTKTLSEVAKDIVKSVGRNGKPAAESNPPISHATEGL